MSDILSQAEIEALLNSLATDTESQPSPVASAPQQTLQKSGGKVFEVYDFRRPDKFSKDQLRTLQMLHETFARLAGSSLSAYLRAPISIDLISLEQVPYEEYLRSINQSVFTVLSIPPLTGQAVLEIELNLIFTMIDRMLGGPGKGVNRSVLTDIERPLIRQMIERMLTALKAAWEGVVIVNPGIEGMETSAQFVQIAPPNDIVVTILFEVRMGNQRTAMSLCIPYLVLKPIATKLSAQKWFAGSNRKVSHAVRKMLSHQINQAAVSCEVVLGESRTSVRDFLKLQVGDIVKLNTSTAHDIKMNVAAHPKFHGKPALNGKKLVFTITDAIEE
ncbi:MAG: flagellar motor switch protein FliM [Armatimonadetes bacterium]|nr:flagellar motor switch protein FliM [Armatimonadota bacterium]